MNEKKTFKDVVVFALPMLVFAVLIIPYNWINSEFIVEWLGCGCPKVDANGEIIHSYFSANDFTTCFWLVISVCVTVLSIFLSKRVSKDKKWFRVAYIAGIFIVAMLLSYLLIQKMMWD